MAVAKQLLRLEANLATKLEELEYDDSVFVYNPLDYALEVHSNFVNRFANVSPKTVLFLGMNPGPWGMAQTGVPFGEVSFVKEWLKVSGPVDQPPRQHPKKPVKGLNSTRREISGQRFYTFFQQLCGSPERFFQNCLVYNHCPLMFVSESGKNLTPPDLKIETRNTLLKLCDETLVSVLDLFAVKHIIALGRYAESRAKKVIFHSGKRNIEVHFMVHPSPASAIANRGWSQLAQSALEKAELLNVIKGESGL